MRGNSIMFFKQQEEQEIEKLDRRIQELEIQNESLNSEVTQLLGELSLTPEQIHAFVTNPSNFSPENWEEMEKHRNALDAKLKRDLDQIRNPLKAKAAYKGRQIPPTWLFVR